MQILVGSTMKVRERQTMGITSGVINVTMIRGASGKNARLLIVYEMCSCMQRLFKHMILQYKEYI